MNTLAGTNRACSTFVARLVHGKAKDSAPHSALVRDRSSVQFRATAPVFIDFLRWFRDSASVAFDLVT